MLAALAGLNPWLVLLLAVGLGTFTRHAMLVGPLAGFDDWRAMVAVALVLGVELVTAKVRRTARWTDRVDAMAGLVVGALLVTGLAGPGGEEPAGWLAALGALAALALRLGRWRLTQSVRDALRPWGHVAVGIMADMLAGAAGAALFAVKP